MLNSDPAGRTQGGRADRRACRWFIVGLPTLPNEVSKSIELIVSNAVLTVGETDDFTRLGGMVRFYFASNRVRFEINPAVSRAAGLRISSRLLRLAKIVDDREGR